MKNIQPPMGAHTFSLPELKAKEAELEASLKEIRSFRQALERFEKSGVMTGQITAPATLFDNQQRGNEYADISVYEGAVIILTKQNQVLTTDEIVEALTKGGKKLGKNARLIVATTLYKAVKQKKNCKIELASKGKWKLNDNII